VLLAALAPRGLLGDGGGALKDVFDSICVLQYYNRDRVVSPTPFALSQARSAVAEHRERRIEVDLLRMAYF
jgi:hypothetical protein